MRLCWASTLVGPLTSPGEITIPRYLEPLYDETVSAAAAFALGHASLGSPDHLLKVLIERMAQSSQEADGGEDETEVEDLRKLFARTSTT